MVVVGTVQRVLLEAPCRSTESSAKVRAAILALFPDARLEEEAGKVRGEAEDLGRLEEMLRNQQIRASAREILLGSVSGGRIVFHLNKQAALSGRVSFSALSPLGEIMVEIQSEDPAKIIHRLAPERP